MWLEEMQRYGGQDEGMDVLTLQKIAGMVKSASRKAGGCKD